LYVCLDNYKKMTIKVPINATKVDVKSIFSKLQKKSKPLKPHDFIGKFPFKGDSLDFQKELR
jgi:hypothetical protein